jgi:hypothetical protein
MTQTLRKLRRGWDGSGQQGYANPFGKTATNSNFIALVNSEQLDPTVAPPTGAFGQICISGAWRTVTEVQIVISGAWRTVSEIQVVNSNAWRNLTT